MLQSPISRMQRHIAMGIVTHASRCVWPTGIRRNITWNARLQGITTRVCSGGSLPPRATFSSGAYRNHGDALLELSSTVAFQIDRVCTGICLCAHPSSLAVRFRAATFSRPLVQFAVCAKSGACPPQCPAPMPCSACLALCCQITFSIH